MSSPLSPFDTVCAARMAVYKRLPYFMKMLFKLAPVERPGAGTFFVDEKLRVHFDPEKAVEWGVEVCATFLAHEVQHPLREHVRRGNAFIERDTLRWEKCRETLMQIHPMLAFSPQMFWNAVADAEINPSVIESGFTFPENFGPVFPETFNLRGGRCAEEYADELLTRCENQMKQNQKTQRPQSGGQRETQGQGGSGPGAPGKDEPKEKPEKPLAGCCGSCAGNRHELEEDAPQENMPNGVSDAEVEVARRQVAHDTMEPTPEMKRLMEQFGIGKVPGSLANWAKAQLAPPEVPWQRVLAPLVRSAVAYARGRVDWKFGRPSRRREAMKQTLGDSAPLLPTLESPVPNVGIVVDTSGSMQAHGASGRTMLDEALSEVIGIVLATGSPCWTAAVDADVQEWVRVRDKRDAAKLIKGCGGTDMRVGIAAAAAKKFDVIVLVTDGWTPWPTQAEMPRRSRVVVCVTGTASVPDYIRPLVRVGAPKETAA